jgi:recombination protein RecT
MAVQVNPELTRQMNHALMSANTQKFISDALPQTVRKYLTPERMGRVVLAAFSKTPALWSCTPASIVRSVVDAATLGLEPVGGALAHGYLVPYGNECQFIISYQGLIELARRSGEFRNLEANVVYERDKLVLRYGFNGTFEHEPYIGSEDRGKVVGAYCMALFKNDERHVTWMSMADIEKRRAASQPGSRGKGPWADWAEEMAVKTVIKKAAKLWPKTAELAAAISIDEGVPSDKAAECIEAEFGEGDAAVVEAVAAPPKPTTATGRLAAKIKKRQEPEPPVAEEAQDEEPPPWEKHLEEGAEDGDAEQ